MKALVGAFNQEKALVGAFSVIVQPVVEPTDRFTALFRTLAEAEEAATREFYLLEQSLHVYCRQVAVVL